MKFLSSMVALAVVGGLVAFVVVREHGTGSGTAYARDRARDALEPIVGDEVAVTAVAPNVPPPLARTHATKVRLDIEVKEHTKTLADGVTYTYWTFGDDAPGNFIRVREGDLVETHFSNHPDNTVAHNIDFHAATGPGGGGEASFIAPGHSVTFAWRAMVPGLYLYHCVAAPAGLHISNGMYGLLLVEPKAGMPKVDREYFLVQGEFYTHGGYGERGHQEFSMEKALREAPDYVVWNGHVGAAMGDRALRVKTGESVRFYLGNAGPSLISSFHIVGEVFDRVYGEGGTQANQVNVQTTMIPVGGSSMVDFVADVPGDYQLVDHSMFRAFNKGAMAMMRVEGPGGEGIFPGKLSEAVYNPGTKLERISSLGTDDPRASTQPASKGAAALTHADHGARVYSTICITCHQADGRGLPNVFPPLAQSDFLMGNPDRAVRVLLKGLQGKITVNGATFDGVMPQFPLTDEEIAAVLTYVRNNFGNRGAPVAVTDIHRVREQLVAEARATGDSRVAVDGP